ncbi:hypothetical protein HPB47_020616 [Ixodes persulcatus]|uniref:Uncharacterized protein n=1 Tax=Ixodes persulcatus TaxID=34615 RepID=A0AC60QEV8_IXOPE|nr:hypothetical protein HPB47_020616 [Ixodes persulcatus]
MHPTLQAEYRATRVKALQKRISIGEGVLYTDAARDGGAAITATAVNQEGEVISSCSVNTSEREVTEEVAIALAIQRLAARNPVVRHRESLYRRAQGPGRPRKDVNESAAIWTPAHSSLSGIEKAHGAARELAHRAGAPLDLSLAFLTGEEDVGGMAPPPDGLLPSPSLLYKLYPDRYKPNFKLCGGHAKLRHLVWEYSRIDRKSHPLLEEIDNQESWEGLLPCADP